MKIVELKIDDSIISGFDATALVESPAIEENFIAFNKVSMAEMTYNDYPQAAVDAAKRGIELNEKNNMKCATQVGKVRAQQLVNGEKLSLDTIQRMRSFLIRQKGNFELATRRKDYNACGYISYLLWGGEAALPWAEKKLRQAGIEFSKFSDEGKDVYLISCSSEKLDYKCAAEEMYDSALFKKSLTFARKQQKDDDYIKILSAKYYLTDLDKVIEPYDLTLKNFSVQQKKDWANKVYSQILDKYSLQYDRFMFLAGNAYTEYLMSKFKYKTDVLEGMRIGERMAYLDKFYIVTNNDDYATKHNFALVDPEAVIVEELIKQEMSVLKSNIPQQPTNEPNAFEDQEILEWLLENGEFEGLDDACQAGYRAIGLKTKNGRKVPNCVPKEDFEINVAGLPNFINEASTGQKRNFASELAEKQMLVGPLMTPGKLIPRVDEKTGEEYQVFFSKETIEKIAYKMMQDKLVDSVNIEHDGAHRVDDAYLVETWIVKDPEADKSVLYGFQPITGQWYGMYKIDNRRVWNEYVKTGKVKGFSVEGYFYNNVLTKK
jgi:hypothetical protein